ncbi:group 1 glycosyl transferase, partial [Leptolyngbya sp. 'hensonii']|uniref:glycosyltransferase n=1 Tax=Leptolyngbya sp. 'hensonii' TaxID=1922337 RepID=UPI00094F89DF
MKILHVTLSVSPRRGGPSEVVLNLVRSLRAQGVDAEIATTNDNGPDGSAPLEVPLEEPVEYEGVPVRFFPQFLPALGGMALGKDRGFVFSGRLTHWLWKHIRDYDVLDTHYLFSYPSTCAGAIARLQQVPYTVRAMGQLSPWALAQSRLKKQVYATLLERSNLNGAAGVHCTSAGEAQDVQSFGVQAPLITLPLGVDRIPSWPEAGSKVRYRYGIAPDTPIVLYLSRLHYKKRPDLLIQVLGQLAAQHHSFHLILAGSGEPEYTAYLEQLMTSLGLTDRATLTGFVAGLDKQLLLQ